MKLLLSLLTLLIGLISAAGASRPNIIIIMADDLGYSDLGCYGSEIATPHLDRLAEGGLRFTHFYNAGRCCPTRAALLTGLYPHQAGVGHMESGLGLPAYQGFLNQRCVTIAEVLKPHGYRTLMAGKWNVGYSPSQWPVRRGFDHFFGLLRGASDYFDPRTGPRRHISTFALDDKPFTDFANGFYLTDAITDYALGWIDKVAESEPFFLYVAYTAPHSPLQAHPEDIAKYRGKYLEGWDAIREQRRGRMVAEGLLEATAELPPRDPRVPAWTEERAPDFQDLKMAVYAAQVECMDRGIGRLVGALESKGVLDDTLILFLSDNGGDGESEGATREPPGPKGSSHIYGRPWAQLSNTPFRGYKHETLEGGIATPLIAHWPATIRATGICREPGHVIDLMATCLDAAGAKYPESFEERPILPLEGRSLVPIFRTGTRDPHRALFWEHEGNRAVRQGSWKLTAMHGRPWQLFRLDRDRGETNDLATVHPEMCRDLSAMYDAWALRCNVAPWEDVKPGGQRR